MIEEYDLISIDNILPDESESHEESKSFHFRDIEVLLKDILGERYKKQNCRIKKSF